MKRIYIIKLGETFPVIKAEYGGFEQWIAAALGMEPEKIQIVDGEQGEPLPEAKECAGVVITGSHAMVTDREPWSVALENWILPVIEAQVPLLGICYGHQLLAQAAGGKVGYHPKGREVGTVDIKLNPESRKDPLFAGLPDVFPAHVVHSQTVLELPEGAVLLASNDHEPHHAYRLGKCAWGVQFHPEFSGNIISSYIREQESELTSDGMDVQGLLAGVEETPVSSGLLARFRDLAMGL